MASDEIWAPVAARLGPYEVSNLARVRRIPAGTIKKQTVAVNGYSVVGLWSQNKGTVAYVHDLVAAAFLKEKPTGMTVNHISGIKADNSPSNLEYISLSENTLHQHASGLARVKGEESGQAKLTKPQVLEIRARALAGERTCDLAAEFGVGSPIISQIKHRQRWAHLP